METENIISVIIPVYNRDVAVISAIESVLYQSHSELELIIVDDGSTDRTLANLENFKIDKRVKILSLPHNGHPGYVRNRGAEMAKGRWLAFLDSDDKWEPLKLEKQLRVLRSRENSRFIHSRERWIRNGKEVSQTHRKHICRGDLFKTSLGKCEIGPSTVVMEKSLFEEFEGFRENLEICEDYEFWLRITDKEDIAYIEEPLTVKMGGEKDQLSTKYGYIENFKIKALKDLVDGGFFTEDHLLLARKELAKKCRIYFRGCEKRGKSDEARKYKEYYLMYTE